MRYYYSLIYYFFYFILYIKTLKKDKLCAMK